MAACVEASLAGMGDHVEDSNRQNAFGEVEILQAYVMAAVDIVAGEDERSPGRAASVLVHQGRMELSTATSSLCKCITDVPQDQDIESVKAMPNELYGLRESVLLPNPAKCGGGVEEVSELLVSDITQKVTEGVTKKSSEHDKSPDAENCVNHRGVHAAIPINGTTEVYTCKPEDYHAVPESAAESRDIVASISSDMIASLGGDGSRNNSSVPAPSNADSHAELSKMRAGPVEKLTTESIGILGDCDATEGAEIVVNEGDIQIGTSILKSSESEVVCVHDATTMSHSFSFTGLNHVALCVENLERSLDFYCGLLGLKTNLDRPELPYRGAWLCLGAEGIHIMEVPNPDPVNGRPAHGGFDRHACLNCKNVEGVRLALESAGIPYQPSIVPSLFTRDPDGNGLEFIEVNS